MQDLAGVKDYLIRLDVKVADSGIDRQE